MITVIADDLTGAAEIAGICIRYGLDVAFGIDSIPQKKATVCIIATDSRSKTEAEAYQIHLQLANLIINNPENQILFKKCDSALRGHILTELKALSIANQKSQILLQPCNPAAQRCIRNGSYWIEGHLIETTGFAHDPDFPATSSSVEKLIIRNASINEVTLVFGAPNKSNWEGIYIPDCNSIDDLKKCAELFHPGVILSGSGAFFEQILIQQGFTNQKKTTIPFNSPTAYLLLSGSTHPESSRFAKKLENLDCPLWLLPDFLLAKETNEIELTEWVKKLGQEFEKKQKLILRTSDRIIQFENSSTLLKRRVSSILEALLQLTPINELYIEGGATAYDILQKLNWHDLIPIAELAPGVIRIQLANDKTQFITIKPGSYSWPEGLLQ